MALFQVNGWDIPSTIATNSGKKQNKKKKEKKVKQSDKSGRESYERSLTTDHEVKSDTTETKRRKKDDGSKKTATKQQKRKNGEIEETTDVERKEANKKPKTESFDTNDSLAKLTPLQLKMKEKLTGSRFRWINEQLYTISSEEATKLIKKNPEMFDEYHAGFRTQVQSWPQNPVDSFINVIKERLQKPINAPGGLFGDKDGTIVVADMGCGEAQLAKDLQNVKGSAKSKRAKFDVRSFDLKKANEFITVADIKNVPMEDRSAHIVVFCLALMGTNFLDFIREGLRILKPKGEIWIAEIKSRFVDSETKNFVTVLKDLGLLHKTTDDSNKMFIRFEFFKPPKDVAQDIERRRSSKKSRTDDEEDIASKGPEGRWLLKPCIYKRR